MFPESEKYSKFLIDNNLEKNEKLKCCNDCILSLYINIKIKNYDFINQLDNPWIKQIFLIIDNFDRYRRYGDFYKIVDFKKLLDNCIDTDLSLDFLAITFVHGNREQFEYLFYQKYIEPNLVKLSQLILEELLYSVEYKTNNVSNNLMFLIEKKPELVSIIYRGRSTSHMAYHVFISNYFDIKLSNHYLKNNYLKWGFLNFALFFLNKECIELILETFEKLGLNFNDFEIRSKILFFENKIIICEDYLMYNINIQHKDKLRFMRKISEIRK